MKKWIGALCSALAGALSLVFLCIPAFSMEMMGFKESYSGWKLLTDKTIGESEYTAVTWYRIFAWILVILAIVLLVVALLQVLSNLNIIKMPAIIDTVAKYALIAIAIVAILTLAANIGIRAEMIGDLKEAGMPDEWLAEYKKAISVGASLWVVAGINLVAAACANLFAKKAK